MSNHPNSNNSPTRGSLARRRNSIYTGSSQPRRRKSVFKTGVNFERRQKPKITSMDSQTDIYESEETRETDRLKAKMDRKFKLLYIPKNYLSFKQDDKSPKQKQKFTRFASLDGNVQFLREKNKIYPSNTISGMKKRLKHNRSAKNLYIEHYNKQQRKAVSMAVDQLKIWKMRNKKMPKVKKRPKHHSMVAGSLLEPTKDKKGKSMLDDSSMMEKRKLVFNSKMFLYPKRKKKLVFNRRSEDKNSLLYKKKKYSKKVRLRNLLKKTGAGVAVANKINKERRDENHARIKHLKEYNFAWYQPQQTNPVLSREGASFNYLKGKGWLIGGIGERILEDIFTYNFHSHEFELVENIQQDIGVPRFNHTSVVHKDKFYIFGGEIFNNLEFRTRRVLNDIKLFDPAWSSVGASGEYVPPRRNHIAVGSGRLMFINGGLGSDGEVLNDTWTFNFESKTWSPMYVNKLPPNLSHHAAAAVFNNPDRVNDIGSRKIKPYYEKYVSHEGIYIFGGKGIDRKPSNKLMMLDVFAKPPTYIEPHTVGQSPPPRFGHCMEYYPNKRFLVIYGGRNDDLYQFSGQCNFDDVHVLNLKYMGWCKVKTGPITPKGRYYFSSFIVDTKIFIFGGLHECNYVSGVTHCLELDEMLAYKMIDHQTSDKILEEMSHPKIEIRGTEEDQDPDMVSMIERQQSPISNLGKMSYFNSKENSIKIGNLNQIKKRKSVNKTSSYALMNIMKSTANLALEEDEENFVSYQPLPNAFSLGNLKSKSRTVEVKKRHQTKGVIGNLIKEEQ